MILILILTNKITNRYSELFALFPSFSAKFLAKRMQTAEKYPKLLGSFVLVQKSGQPGMVKSSSGCAENPGKKMKVFLAKYGKFGARWTQCRIQKDVIDWLMVKLANGFKVLLILMLPIIVDGNQKYIQSNLCTTANLGTWKKWPLYRGLSEKDQW